MRDMYIITSSYFVDPADHRDVLLSERLPSNGGDHGEGEEGSDRDLWARDGSCGGELDDDVREKGEGDRCSVETRRRY